MEMATSWSSCVDCVQIDMSLPIIFAGSLRHHLVNGSHLWLIPETGAYCVLSESEHFMMLKLANGGVPIDILGELLIANMLEPSLESMNEFTHKLFKNLSASGMIEGIEGLHRLGKPLRPEKFARFHLTNACQLKCIHCYMNSSPMIDRSGELSTERWKSLIEQYADAGGEEILFSGGEPLLREDCCELFEYAKSKKLRVLLLTNGLLIGKYLDRLKHCVDAIQISLGSPEEFSNDAIRGEGTYRKIVNTLDLLSKNKFVEAGVHIKIHISALEMNLDVICKEMMSFIEKYRPDGFEFDIGCNTLPSGRGDDLEESKNAARTEEKKQYLSGILDQITIPVTQFKTDNTNNCGYCGKLVINANGFVHPCHLEIGILGHIDDMSIADWCLKLHQVGSDYFVENIDGCATCDLRRMCGGSCIILNEKYTNNKRKTYCDENVRQKFYERCVELAVNCQRI